MNAKNVKLRVTPVPSMRDGRAAMLCLPRRGGDDRRPGCGWLEPVSVEVRMVPLHPVMITAWAQVIAVSLAMFLFGPGSEGSAGFVVAMFCAAILASVMAYCTSCWDTGRRPSVAGFFFADEKYVRWAVDGWAPSMRAPQSVRRAGYNALSREPPLRRPVMVYLSGDPDPEGERAVTAAVAEALRDRGEVRAAEFVEDGLGAVEPVDGRPGGFRAGALWWAEAPRGGRVAVEPNPERLGRYRMVFVPPSYAWRDPSSRDHGSALVLGPWSAAAASLSVTAVALCYAVVAGAAPLAAVLFTVPVGVALAVVMHWDRSRCVAAMSTLVAETREGAPFSWDAPAHGAHLVAGGPDVDVREWVDVAEDPGILGECVDRVDGGGASASDVNESEIRRWLAARDDRG